MFNPSSCLLAPGPAPSGVGDGARVVPTPSTAGLSGASSLSPSPSPAPASESVCNDDHGDLRVSALARDAGTVCSPPSAMFRLCDELNADASLRPGDMEKAALFEVTSARIESKSREEILWSLAARTTGSAASAPGGAGNCRSSMSLRQPVGQWET